MLKRPEIAPADFFEPLEIEPVAIIPFDVQLFGNAANSGRMISEIDAKSPIAETFSQIAHIVTGRSSARKAKRAGLGKFMDLIKRK
jgi:pilus assembly protein CpaE